MYGLNLLRNPGRNAVIAFVVLLTLLLVAIGATIAALGYGARTGAVLLILALGFASRAALGFTPTIWVSGDRTNLYLLYAFGLAAMIIIGTELTPRRTPDEASLSEVAEALDDV